MNITELSVRRPAAITMGVALNIGLGVVGYVNLGADLSPAVNTRSEDLGALKITNPAGQQGISDDSVTEITRGLSEGAMVITEGQSFLNEGKKRRSRSETVHRSTNSA